MAVQVWDGGQLRRVSSPLWSLDATRSPIGGPHVVDFLGDSSPRAIYESQRSVRTVVDFLARNAAGVSLHAYRRDDDGDRERLRYPDPLAGALLRPDVTTSPYSHVRALVTDLCLYERYAALKMPGADPGSVQIVRVPPTLWRFERDSFNRPLCILLETTTGQVRLELDRLLWIDGYPDVQHTPMKAIADLLDEERAAATFRTELWRNGGKLSGWISRPKDAPKWSKTGRERFAASWRRNYGEGGARAGGTPLLEDGMEYHEMSAVAPKDAQATESRQLSLVETAAVYGVPAVLVGVLGDANYSNVQAFREQVYTDVLGPFFQRIKEAYDLCLVPEFDRSGATYVEFNVQAKLALSFEEQAKSLTSAVGGPYMLRSEARARMNLPRIDGADELIVPLNVVEGGQASPLDSAPPTV